MKSDIYGWNYLNWLTVKQVGKCNGISSREGGGWIQCLDKGPRNMKSMRLGCGMTLLPPDLLLDNS